MSTQALVDQSKIRVGYLSVTKAYWGYNPNPSLASRALNDEKISWMENKDRDQAL